MTWYILMVLKLKLKREISQTRTKAKEFIQSYLHVVAFDVTVPAGPTNDRKIKEQRVEALKHLVEQKEKYLYRHAIYEVVDGISRKKRGPHDPYRSQYIRNC